MGDPAEKTPEETALTNQYRHESLMLAREALKDSPSIFLNVIKFEHCQRVSNMLAASTMVPEAFQENVGNCMIALNYADRLNVDVFMLMQSMYVVHGKPGIEGKMVIALINKSGLFVGPLQWEFTGEKEKDEWTCTAFAKHKETGEILKQSIDWKMVKRMGWYNKKGPDKTVESNFWRSIPEQMFKYRTASWFANSYCPEVKMGLYTVEELKELDAVPMIQSPNGTFQQAEVSTEKPEKLYEANTTVDKSDVGGDVNVDLIPDNIDWDPLKNPVQQRYESKKAQIIKTECRKRGMQVDGLLPRLAHEMLLEDEKKKSEGEAHKPEIVDPEPNDEPKDSELSEQEKIHAVIMTRIEGEINEEPVKVETALVNAQMELTVQDIIDSNFTKPETLEDAQKLEAELNQVMEGKF